MPPPTLLEWCTTSISSIQQSVHQMFNNRTKLDFATPVQLTEIQAVDGQTPGDKWKSFNATVNGIVESVKTGGDLDSQLNQVSPMLLNLVKVNVGAKLQISQLIVEALKSEDISIGKRAQSAEWFFDGGNPNVTVDYFANEILPFVSVRTRLDIVKKLARGLQQHPDKAQQFFVKLVEMYDVYENLSILTACSENFILDAIIRYKIVLPFNTLNFLFSKYRDLVVYYLHLGNSKNTENTEDRKVHEIRIHDYDAFLPKLIRDYPEDFVALYELTPDKNMELLSIHRSCLLLASVKQTIITKSDIFLKLLQPKVVKSKLNAEEIETMLEHYLPKDIMDFLLHVALEFVENYLGNDKITVLISKFEKLYGKNLLDYARKLIDSDNKFRSSVLKLLRLLPPTERERQIKMLLCEVNEAALLKNVFISFLKPTESLPYFKDKISKSSSADERIELIGLMIISCGVKGSKEDLLSVLQYYKDKHKNEQNFVLCRFFEHLKSEFDLKTLDDAHWSTLLDIINNAYIKKELFTSHVTLIESVLEAMLHHAMTRKKKNERHVEKAIEMIVECKIENFSPSWNVLKDIPAMEKECLERFYLLVPVKYPEHHQIWKRKNDRLVLALSLLESITSFNNRSATKRSKRKRNVADKPKESINLKDYPWILKLTEEFFSRSATGIRKEKLLKLVKQQAPEFYESKMDESSVIRDISNGEALKFLKRQPDKVLTNWLDYLNEAREKLQKNNSNKARDKLRARSFIGATKWHRELPVKFIETCLAEIKVEGSLAVLGILLPGEAFEKLVAPFVPQEAEINAKRHNAKESFELTRSILEGMMCTNPPVSLQSLQPLCRGDYVLFAEGTLMSLANRVSTNSALDFAKNLANQPQASLMKRGIRLAKSVATKQQFRDILRQTWAASTDVSIRKLLSKMIFEVFVKSPNEENWQLMRSCLRGLSVDDKEALEDLNEIEKIATKFLSEYVEEYVNKVEELFAASLDFKWRTKSVSLLVESFDEKLMSEMSEEVSLKILEKYFFDADCSEISRATRIFAVRYYLLPSAEKFDTRLKSIMKILTNTIESFDTPHPKKRRYYPANYSIQEFFGDLLNELCASENKAKKLQIVEKVLEIFHTNLSPWQEPLSFLNLNLYKEYLLSSSPKDFGIRTAKRLGTLVEDFSSNEPIADVAECLNDFIFHKIFREHKNPFALKLSLIEGLLQGDDHYGALTSMKLLNPHEVAKYDERYDRLIARLRQMKNSSIQYNLYQHLNSLTEQ